MDLRLSCQGGHLSQVLPMPPPQAMRFRLPGLIRCPLSLAGQLAQQILGGVGGGLSDSKDSETADVEADVTTEADPQAHPPSEHAAEAAAAVAAEQQVCQQAWPAGSVKLVAAAAQCLPRQPPASRRALPAACWTESTAAAGLPVCSGTSPLSMRSLPPG